MLPTKTKEWLKGELVSALGFADVDEIVNYITSTFDSKQEASSYLIELLGIPAKRAEHISTRLFLSVPFNAKSGNGAAVTAAAAGDLEQLDSRPKIINSRLKLSKKSKKASLELLNNALIINCLRCGRIEYNGARRCEFCDSELHYEADAFLTDQAARQQMKELDQAAETDAMRPRPLEAEQHCIGQEHVESNAQGSSVRRFIPNALDLNNRHCVEVKMTRNQQLTRDARELVDGIQRKMSKVRRGKSSLPQQADASSESNALAVVNDSYNLVYV